jgi:hypothetical protein
MVLFLIVFFCSFDDYFISHKFNKRGIPGLDKIFASEEHWTGSGADAGTGRSDHPAIIADLTF